MKVIFIGISHGSDEELKRKRNEVQNRTMDFLFSDEMLEILLLRLTQQKTFLCQEQKRKKCRLTRHVVTPAQKVITVEKKDLKCRRFATTYTVQNVSMNFIPIKTDMDNTTN
jgi:hypothetical protein